MQCCGRLCLRARGGDAVSHEIVQDLPRLLQTCPKLPLGPVTQENVLLQSICDTFHSYCLGPSGCLSECAVACVSFNTFYAEVYWSSSE